MFNCLCFRVSKNVASKINYPVLRSTLAKIRSKTLPPIPDDFKHFETGVQGTKFADFYDATLLDNDETITVFTDKALLNKFKKKKRGLYHMDGTFKVRPPKPTSRQLFTIMGVYKNHVSEK